MRIVVYPHDLQIGGSQLNAIEIAARVQALGHECIIFGRPGPLVDRIDELGLEFVASPEPGRRPSPAAMGALDSLVRERDIDVLHGYEWPPALEAWMVSARQSHRAVAATGTVMSMAVAPFLPRTLPLVVGTEQIAAAERLDGRRLVTVIEPPVDLELNEPSISTGVDDFRRQWGLSTGDLVIVVVTRLAHEMKLEGLLVAIDTIPELSADRPIRLVIVGGGPARDVVADRAGEVNQRLGRDAVVLTGEIADPRPAYGAADIMIGMGGSALRSLAFAKPLIVQGERGFWRLLTPATVDEFLWTGWYGVGSEASAGSDTLCREISRVVGDADLRSELGVFGRQLVVGRFGLDSAAEQQLRVYEAALRLQPGRARHVLDAGRSGVQYARYVAGRRIARIAGRRKVDDFNSRPVVANGPGRPTGGQV